MIRETVKRSLDALVCSRAQQFDSPELGYKAGYETAAELLCDALECLTPANPDAVVDVLARITAVLVGESRAVQRARRVCLSDFAPTPEILEGSA